MMSVIMHNVDLREFQAAVGSAFYASGIRHVQQHAVVQMRWEPSTGTLYGTVRGAGGALYTPIVRFDTDDVFAAVFDRGLCSCPVGYNCEHVAALVLMASGEYSRAIAGRAPKPVGWEQSLGSLLDSRPAGLASQPGETPLAIELTLSADVRPARATAVGGAAARLQARLVKPGKTGWVGSGLSWSRLSTLQPYDDYRAPHVGLLRELYALYQSRSHAPAYGYGEERLIDLAAFDSHRLWPMLDEAEAVGVRLVHGKKRLGALDRYGSARLCLDITDDELAGLRVNAVLQVDETDVDVTAVRFIGADGHGVVYVDRAEALANADRGDWRIRLARLEKAVPPQLQQMALENRSLEIPAAERSLFRDQYYPRLRNMAIVVSSDQSFTPPAISDPRLMLHADYGVGHDLIVSWEWVYDIGDSRLRAPLRSTQPPAGYRNLEQERDILANLEVPLDRFEPLSVGPGAGPGPTLAPHADLSGSDAMRFTTEVLPLLADQPGVCVEISGDPPDYREVGDSLRIGVSAGEVLDETDWFDLGVTITVDGRDVPFATVFSALSRDEPYMLLDDGAYFSLQKPELQGLRKLIEEARGLQDAPEGQLRISRFQAGLWAELAELGVVNYQARAWREQVQGLLAIESVGSSTPPPPALAAQLRPYQLEGFRWLAFLWEYRLGGILADDMGLGKTLQALALICHAKQADPTTAPFLIVAPTSVVSNWTVESARFAPGLNVVALSDTLRRRGKSLAEIIGDADVVVTSYTLFRLDFDAYSAMPWAGLVLDEAQFTKNHQSKIYQCARRLPAPFKLAITGTPMENNLMELWSLLSIAAPGLFPHPTQFRYQYARPIEQGGDAELLARLRRRVRPLVKRRTKEQVVAELPAKQEQVLEVELHPRHRKIYQTHLQRERQKVLGLIDDMNKNRFTILRSLTLLRQLSLHAALVDDVHEAVPCSKVDALLEQLQDVTDGGHRALVFSQFTRFLGIVRQRLDTAGIEYCYLDGKTRDRATVLKRFKDGAVPVFLISLKAGGFGLNLTEADYCFLLDPWWNPATEAQAVDRTHRIGQTRQVMVYRLIAKDTIEEKVMALKARKAELFSSVIDDGNVFGASLDADDIRALFA